MADYKAMYYHLAGRMANAVDTLEATTNIMEAMAASLDATTKAMVGLKESLKTAQQKTEDMFISCDEEDGENDG